jgi:glycosyltransferase involved in cell wall biosynthesis
VSEKFSVIFFAGYFLPYRGGYANSIFQLARQLRQKGHVVSVLTNNTENSPEQETRDGILIYRLDCWHILGKTYPIPKPTFKNYRILRAALPSKPFIISTQTRFFVTSIIGLLVAWLKKQPLIHTERGSQHSEHRKKVIYFIGLLVDHIFGWLLVKRANLNIGVSTGACAFLRHLGASRVELIPNGVNEFFLQAGDSRPGVRASSDTISIIFFGRLIYAKGVQDLIKVFYRLSSKITKAKLYILGSGNYRSQLETLVNKNTPNREVVFTGELDSGGIIEIMKKSDIFVNPSYSEGLPTSVLEAGAAGLAVIATNVGGTADIVKSEETGFLYEPHHIDKLQGYLEVYATEPILRQKHGQALKAFIIKNFSWEKVALAYLEHFSKINS